MPTGEGNRHYRGAKAFWDDLSLVAAKEVARMDKMISCKFNMDNACVELRFADGTMISIDTIAVENEVADNMYERSELDYLLYNAPLEYADLILNGDPAEYLKTVTVYKPFEN